MRGDLTLERCFSLLFGVVFFVVSNLVKGCIGLDWWEELQVLWTSFIFGSCGILLDWMSLGCFLELEWLEFVVIYRTIII